MPEEQANALIAALTEFVLEILERQMATESLLRKAPGADPGAVETEMRLARERIDRIPLVQDLRVRRDPSQLAMLLRTLRNIR